MEIRLILQLNKSQTTTMTKYFTSILLFISLINLFAQQDTQPTKCTNPGAGIFVGGDFTVSPSFACLDFTDNQATFNVSNSISPSGGQLNNVGYIFNFKDGDEISGFSTETSATVSKPGTYWIMQAGNSEGKAYITCKSVEAIQTETPDFTVYTFGKTVTVTFLNTSKNRKQSKYRIVWGNGDFTTSPQISVWPFSMKYTYNLPPTLLPRIEAIYTRGGTNFDACKSSPLRFSVALFKPTLSELEALDGGKSAKITLVEGLDNYGYTIQKKIKDGVWEDTGKKITRNLGINFAQETIDGLNPEVTTYLRLQGKDEYNNEVFSNEVYTINLKTTLLSDTEARLDWNISDTTNLEKTIISYSEENGGNFNTIALKKQNNFTVNFLQCNKKYKFKIQAFFNPNNKVTIISPEVSVDPTSIKEFPAPDNIGIVSVYDSKEIRFNVLELDNKKSKYHFYRSVNGGVFEKIAESVDNTLLDSNVDVEKNYYCYNYKYENECGILSDFSINRPCNILLGIDNTTLKWNPFLLNKSTTKITYYVELIDEAKKSTTIGYTQDVILNIKSIIENSTTNKPLTFRVKGVANYSLNLDGNLTKFPIDTYSNEITYSPILSNSYESEILKIFPNPSEENIQFNSTFQLKTAEIVDFQGKTIEKQTIEENQISVKQLPKGKYILRLYDQQNHLISNKTIVKM